MNIDIPIIQRRTGVNYRGQSAVISLWATKAQQIHLVLSDGAKLPLQESDQGIWTLETTALKNGDTYQFELITKEGTMIRPDPASLYQPQGVHGPSQSFDLKNYQFNDLNWKGIPLAESIIYELHVGTFSEEGTFEGITKKLDHLLELGINTIELMPVAAFSGSRNWGYDGVFPFAAQHEYGGPQKLQELIDNCHQKGIAVILDVVYNHIGPEGNYLGDFAPYFNQEYQTVWGPALNFDSTDSPLVRAFFLENALMWLRDFHFDGLRLDAIHAIKDSSAIPLLAELRGLVDQLAAHTQRNYYLIIESDLNNPKHLIPLAQNGQGMHGHWNDDFHHSLRVSVGEPPQSYYGAYNGLEDLAKSFNKAYVYDGKYSAVRKLFIGDKPTQVSSKQFVVFSQNHDQIGNRMKGERPAALYGLELQKLMAGTVFISPYVPQLFMGEEWASPGPFLYFVDHQDPELIEQVRKGRQAEFNHEGEAPDPFAESTFNDSKLRWDALNEPQHQQLFAYYKDLIRLRKKYKLFTQIERHQYQPELDLEKSLLSFHLKHQREELFCCMNFSTQRQLIHLPEGRWSLALDSAANAYGGNAEPSMMEPPHLINPQSIQIYTVSHV